MLNNLIIVPLKLIIYNRKLQIFVGKFTFCKEYAQFVNLYTDDTEKFEEVNNRKKDLAEQVKIYWENEGKIS